MRHIAYSSIANDLTMEEFSALVAHSQARNAARGIRGAIAFDGRMISQILEGEGEVVDALFRTITDDPRHGGVVLTARADISESQFAGFGMVRMSPSELYLLSARIVERYGEGDSSSEPLDLSV